MEQKNLLTLMSIFGHFSLRIRQQAAAQCEGLVAARGALAASAGLTLHADSLQERQQRATRFREDLPQRGLDGHLPGGSLVDLGRSEAMVVVEDCVPHGQSHGGVRGRRRRGADQPCPSPLIRAFIHSFICMMPALTRQWPFDILQQRVVKPHQAAARSSFLWQR